MAWINQKLRQRLLGAFVLTALAIIFLPMLLTRTQDPAQVQIEVPDMPTMPDMPKVQVETVTLPEPPAVNENNLEAATNSSEKSAIKEPNIPITDNNKSDILPKSAEQNPQLTQSQPVKRLDTAHLPIAWSVQLSSLKNHSNAEKMRDDLRRKGYNAYIRSADGMSKVLVGPLIDRSAANNLRSELETKQHLKGFVVRFQPQ